MIKSICIFNSRPGGEIIWSDVNMQWSFSFEQNSFCEQRLAEICHISCEITNYYTFYDVNVKSTRHFQSTSHLQKLYWGLRKFPLWYSLNFPTHLIITWTVNVALSAWIPKILHPFNKCTNIRQIMKVAHTFINEPCFLPRFRRKLFPPERSIASVLWSDRVNLRSSRCVVPLQGESEKKAII